MSTLATLVVKLTADTGQFIDDMQDAEKGVGGFLKGVGKNVQSVGKVALSGLGIAAGAAGAAGAAILKLASDAAPLETVRDSFAQIAETSGSSQAEMLAALERGSAGMINQRDLMLSYNKAAQLVSPTFANELPSAMDALSKVAASTGQDMGFMLDSLVTGVGRLSPMILDNLGIQVDLTAANEAYATQLGKTVAEMTKGEQQAALMAQVQQKLAENTAALPEVAGTAAAGIAQFAAMVQNAKDEVGMAFIPILNALLPVVLELARMAMPYLTEAARTLGQWLADLVPTVEEVVNWLGEARQWVMNLIDEIWPMIEPIAAWIGENVKLEDVLIALGITIVSVIIPAIGTLIATAAPIILTFAAILAAVTLLRQAWESDFLGIRTALTEFWEGTGRPALEALWDWLQVKIPEAIERTKRNWDTLIRVFRNIGSAIQDVIGWIRDLADKIGNIRLPDWLRPGSPTPFELGLRGIGDEMERLARFSVPGLEGSLAPAGSTSHVEHNRNFEFNIRGQRVDDRSLFGAYETIRALESL